MALDIVQSALLLLALLLALAIGEHWRHVAPKSVVHHGQLHELLARDEFTRLG
jgi:hypothetical protein